MVSNLSGFWDKTGEPLSMRRAGNAAFAGLPKVIPRHHMPDEHGGGSVVGM